eukprot:g2909.t1
MASPLQGFRSARAFRTAFARDLPSLQPSPPTSAAAFRARARAAEWTDQNSGQAPGHVHANLVLLPEENAFDFLRFCLDNPRPCPLLAVTAPGDPCVHGVAPGSDLRTDCPRYSVYRYGELVDSPTDVVDLYNDQMGGNAVGFLLGCSFTWERELSRAGLEPRHITNGTNVPMYHTNVPNNVSGPFGGELVVSMRPFASEDDCMRAAAITGRYPGAHGAPVHWGDPEMLGIDTAKVVGEGASPDWGDAVNVGEDEVPCFWACGVTPHTALMKAKLPIAITHSPGHMFITDLMDHDLLLQADESR